MVKLKTMTFLILCIIFVINNSCTSDYSKKIGNGYTYRDEGGDLKDIFHKNQAKGGEIPSTVVSYDYNSKFIIAKQKPKLPQDILYNKEYNYNRGDTAFYYWIIIKKEHIVLGPLGIEEFNKKKKEYKVCDKLKLE